MAWVVLAVRQVRYSSMRTSSVSRPRGVGGGC